MTIPASSVDQHRIALEKAWTAGERADTLMENNNGSSAVVWAAVAHAWAGIASAASNGA